MAGIGHVFWCGFGRDDLREDLGGFVALLLVIFRYQCRD
jgi:hypothetical protein